MADRKGHTVGESWMLGSCHIMAHTTDWVVYLVCMSVSQSEKLCMVPGPPKLHIHLKIGVVCEQGIDARANSLLGADNAKPA